MLGTPLYMAGSKGGPDTAQWPEVAILQKDKDAQGALMWCLACSPVQLTELKALLGCVGQTRFVCGAIAQLADGRYFLEDLSDALPIDLSGAATTSGLFTGAPI